MDRTVAVVGGGPAGLMAAEVLATAGVHVIVFDRMRSPGRKFQLAGRGGLNLTHTEPLEAFLDRYGETARPALEPAIRGFDPAALRAWSTGLGQRAVVGTSGRVFPEAFRATPLLRAWIARLLDLGVELCTRHTWCGWTDDGTALVFDPPGTTVRADGTVLAVGGASWPGTGSDGGWVGAVEAAGIRVTPLRAANSGVRIAWTDHLRDHHAGTPLKNIALRCRPTRTVVRGEAVITATGLEGGAVYAIGRAVRTALDARAPAVLELDLRPDLTEDELVDRLRHRRRPKDSLSATLKRAAGLTPAGVALLREPGASGRIAQAGDDPVALARRIKGVRLTVTGTEPLDRAISTAGGIVLDEVDERFMLRRRPGTFVAGEMLDWDAPTGGYLLQASFSTGAAAARGVLAHLEGRE